MNAFDRIKEDIMADKMNEQFTKQGIPPLFKVSKEARSHCRSGARAKSGSNRVVLE